MIVALIWLIWGIGAILLLAADLTGKRIRLAGLSGLS